MDTDKMMISKREEQMVGFEVEYGKIKVKSINENKVVLAQSTEMIHGAPFIKLVTDGAKSADFPYLEIVSAPLNTIGDIKRFAGINRQIRAKTGVKRKTRLIDFVNEIFESGTMKIENESIEIDISGVSEISPQVNIAIPYTSLCCKKATALTEIFGESDGAGKISQNPFCESRRIVNENATLKSLSDTIRALLVMFFYQEIIYINEGITPSYHEILPGTKLVETSENSCQTGSDDSSAKLKFKTLIKAGKADIIREVLSQEERDEFIKAWKTPDKKGIETELMKELNRVATSLGKLTVSEKSRKKRLENTLKYLKANFDIGNAPEKEMFYDEPRISGLIPPYWDQEKKKSFIVLECRKENEVIELTKATFQDFENKQGEKVEKLTGRLSDLYKSL